MNRVWRKPPQNVGASGMPFVEACGMRSIVKLYFEPVADIAQNLLRSNNLSNTMTWAGPRQQVA